MPGVWRLLSIKGYIFTPGVPFMTGAEVKLWGGGVYSKVGCSIASQRGLKEKRRSELA